MQGTVDRFLWNGTTSYLRLAIKYICGFALVPVVLHCLGKEDYGLLHLVGSLVGCIPLASLGTGTAIVRSVAEVRDSVSAPDVSPTISTAFFFYLCLSSLGLIAALFLSDAFLRLFRIPPEQVGVSQVLLIICLAGAMISFPLSVFTGILMGRERFDLLNILQMVQAVAFLLAGLLILWTGGRLIAFVATYTAVSALAAIATAWLAYREVPSLRLSLRMVRISELRHLLSFGLFVFCVNVAMQISYQADPIVIGLFLPMEAIAIYNIGLRLSEIMREIPAQINHLLPPLVARLNERCQPGELQQVFLESTKWVLVIAFTVATPLAAFSQPLIRSWVGEGFGSAVLVTEILCIAGIVAIGQAPAGTLLMFKGKHKVLAGISLATSGANLFLSLILIRPFGIIGVALATAIATVVGDAFLNIPLACRLIGLPVRQLLRNAVLPAMTPAVGAFALAVTIQHELRLEHFLPTVLAMAVTAGVYLLLFARLFVSAEDRSRYMFHLRGAIWNGLVAAGRP